MNRYELEELLEDEDRIGLAVSPCNDEPRLWTHHTGLVVGDPYNQTVLAFFCIYGQRAVQMHNWLQSLDVFSSDLIPESVNFQGRVYGDRESIEVACYRCYKVTRITPTRLITRNIPCGCAAGTFGPIHLVRFIDLPRPGIEDYVPYLQQREGRTPETTPEPELDYYECVKDD